uniref:TonB-dependent transporter Oar-like beta-barrel domain-containing protein n=1 Tax=mine drainage metagenome TaxID=410659 RepID=E6PZ23_9ZZZZ
MTEIVSNINSNYNALVLQAEHRLTNGVQFQTSCTFSKALDYGQNQTSGADVNDPFDPFTVAYDYGKSVTNIPQHFVGSLVWEPMVTTANRVLKMAVNGWLVSPIFTEESGLPYSYGVNGTDTKVQTVPGASGSLNGSGGANFLPLAGRNTLEQPRIEDVDLRLSRSMIFADKYRLEALTEAFNLFNRENFTSVNTTAYSVSGTVLNAVGNFTVPNTAGNTIYRERQIQFALRLEF